MDFKDKNKQLDEPLCGVLELKDESVLSTVIGEQRFKQYSDEKWESLDSHLYPEFK